MRKAFWKKHILNFSSSRGTSRGILNSKPSYFIVLEDSDSGTAPLSTSWESVRRSENKGINFGVGECGILPGLSCDDKPGYEEMLTRTTEAWLAASRLKPEALNDWPSIRFGFETAQLHLQNGDFSRLFDTPFSHGIEGIEINGLVWMNSYEVMLEELKSKIESGFSCIKIKIGAVDFEDELKLIQHIRNQFSAVDITIRVDANGAFSPEEASAKLDALAKLQIHSIEQPIKAGQWREMEKLCRNTPIPIALDEELIGLNTSVKRQEMMAAIKPQAVILKPSLVGGFEVCDEWIDLCEKNNAFWWATSALESNIGLNAIAQYTASKILPLNSPPKGDGSVLAQGLGTGLLYENNFPSPLEIRGSKLFYNSDNSWEIPFLK